MKIIISSLLITFGLVFLGLSQRYDYVGKDAEYRIDKLTGKKEWCSYYCEVEVGGIGIFKIFTNHSISKREAEDELILGALYEMQKNEEAERLSNKKLKGGN
jgi:hypothetical protein